MPLNNPTTTTTAITATAGDSSTNIANTAFVQSAISNTGNPYQASGTIDVVSRANVQTAAVLTSGTCHFTCFTPSSNTTVGQFVISTGPNSAMVGATLIRMGLYTYVDSTATATLIAASTNNTGLFTAVSTSYTQAFSTPSITLVAGQRYAVGIVVVATTPPQIASASIAGVTADLLPHMARQKALAGDLPAPSVVTARASNMFNTRLTP